MTFSPRAIRKWFLAICATIVLTGSWNSAFAADITFHRSLSSSGPVALKVCTNSGTVVVTGAEGNKVEISAKIHNSKWSAFGNTERMKAIAADPPVIQSGNVVHVGNQETCGRHLLQNIAIDYVISVPKSSSVVVNSGSGDIHVATIQSFVRAASGSGSIKATDIGPASRLETGSGTVDIQSAHGDVKAISGSGDLAIRDSDVTEARLRAGSGNITAINLQGGLRANTGSGSLTLSGSPGSDWKIETGTGTIRCHLNANSKFTLDAETGSGAVHSKLPMPNSGHGTNSELRGPVNGGGPIVKMSTGSGDIEIE
ncbi:MAG TPA: DUF4097 family beta strand repeat-containing protein [Acidobacteriaceae bacterium]|nr:DUF4097 family beta strand repeat-containing protein [Acidobacteriaceae bacterium]